MTTEKDTPMFEKKFAEGNTVKWNKVETSHEQRHKDYNKTVRMAGQRVFSVEATRYESPKTETTPLETWAEKHIEQFCGGSPKMEIEQPYEPPKIVKLSCELCGYRGRFSKSAEGQRCPNCSKPYDKPVNVIPGEEVDGPVSNYNQISWWCGECHSKGIIWVKKFGTVNKRSPCPNCQTTAKMHTNRIDPKGRCDESGFWSEGQFTPPPPVVPRPKKLTHVCPNCRFKTRYLMRPPEKCKNCGHVNGERDDSDQ